ncbi:hypothetical protein JMJ55_02995 [Belnapia sp. T6]|uniref:Ankyrin repeat domain-containing protein n=1 Tax=Belnapia mucosa TaxID=2804532 RepID=A0ABS1UXT1_9PROT|nr:hypothetical protein [Belnapia mucosa]MBL6454275.1 hypothetical protein [Belnapia mucosa]
MRHLALLPPLALLATLALPVPEAVAQFGRNGRAGGMSDPAQEASRPPPAALPGLQYRRAPEPIPADPNQNLSPNAALFDAINRGDIASAREAVGRGADTESRNVLGLTPIDAAVDQGRNDILFFLLSVRAGSRGGPPAAGETQAAAPPARPAPRRADATPPPAAPVERAAAATPVAPPRQAPNPRLWAGDGGAANPGIGFLGFDAGRPADAMPPAVEHSAPPRRAGRG